MRLIDADELMEKANEHYRLALKRTEEAPFNDRYREQTIEREKFLGFIGNAPTVEPSHNIVVLPHEVFERMADIMVDIIYKIDWNEAIEAYKLSMKEVPDEVADDKHI